MKRIAAIFGLSLFLALPSWLMAQQDVPPPPPPPPPQYEGPPPPPSRQYAPPQHSAYFEDHGEVGIYADYFRFAPGNYNNNFVGVGARVGFNVHPNIALEAEMNYDFARNFTSTFNNGGTTSFVKTSVRPLSGFFGPKIQIGRSSAVRAFVEGKIGFIDFSTSSAAVTGGTFGNTVTGIGGSGTHIAFFPGGGIEAFAGPIGLRLDVGDEVYLNNGAYNNLRVTLGPTIRF